MTFGEKLNLLRKKAGFTQEEVAQHLGISPQAVSKWENDLSCPDIMLLPEIAKLYGQSVDELLSTENLHMNDKEVTEEKTEENFRKKETENTGIFSAENKTSSGNMFLKVNVLSKHGDKIDVKLPLSLIKSMKNVLGNIKTGNAAAGSIDLSEIDFDMIFELVDSGAMGEIVNMVSQNGDTIRVYAERDEI